MQAPSDQKWMVECRHQIEDKLQWGDPTEWHNEVFEELSETIAAETQVRLSPTTLKRIWGRLPYSNSPSITTRNALSQFLGYHNWREFKEQNPVLSAPSVHRAGRWSKNQVIIITSASLLTVVFISFFSLIDPSNDNPLATDLAQVKFSSHPVTRGLPNSVVFEFDIEGIATEQLQIQQFWDPTKTIDLERDQKQATGIYYYPGYFRSKLLVNGYVIREHDLYIKSDGWLGTLDYKPVPKYLDEGEINRNGIRLPSNVLHELSISDEPITTTYHYVEDFDGLSADDFTLKAKVQNSYQDKWAVCQRTSFIILGSESAIIVPFSIMGCVSELNVMISDQYISGKENDLSNLAADFSEFREIAITVNNKKLAVILDHEEVFQSRYSADLGDFAGFRIRFLGAGQVVDLSILNHKGDIIFSDRTGIISAQSSIEQDL